MIISTYESDDMGETLTVDPTEGTVAFGSALYGWAFTVTHFAKIFAKKFKIDENVLTKKFWGNNFYNAATKKFTSSGVT